MASDRLQHALSHVRWIGGSVCAGKSSVARVLAERTPLRLYHCDQHEAEHVARSHPDRHPTMAAFSALSMDERWVRRSPEAMAESSARWHVERFDLIVADLLAGPRDPPSLVEGFGLFPELVSAVIRQAHQAVWLVATPAFLTAMRYRRGMTVPDQTSDPERARRNLIARDILMADRARRSAAECGLPLVEVDGSRSIDETARLVARLLLLSAPRQ
jgi:hypothetical protein